MSTPPLRWTVLFLLAAFCLTASAGEPPETYSMEILVDGVALTEYPTGGRTYVEALAGREYGIRLTNHGRQRIAVALSVDGLNTIDAKTTRARKASKWILGPHQSITIHGWQTGSSTARNFFFTTEDQSYGAWLGRTENLGLIAAAVFRERTRPSKPISAPLDRLERKSSADAPGERAAAEPSEGMAATGIGREVGHTVRRVEFDAEERPAAVVELRYEYRPELVRLGILPRYCPEPGDPLTRRERSRGFDDSSFAPDPYRDGR